jgi:hypothetical protein
MAVASLVALTAALLPAPWAGLSGSLFVLVSVVVPLAVKYAIRTPLPA